MTVLQDGNSGGLAVGYERPVTGRPFLVMVVVVLMILNILMHSAGDTI